LPSLDTDTVERRVLTESDSVAWVSVNLRGCVAYVQIRPLLRPESARARQTTNLVAQCDGVIDSVRLIAGEAVVAPGELVRAGQLLVAGVRYSSAQGYTTVAAQGEVLARVEDTVNVFLPRQMSQNVYGETKILEKTLFFFRKIHKNYKKYWNYRGEL
jgi:similar to stage IV sporulation protein